MEGKQIIGAVLGTIFRISISIIVVYYIYNLAIESYNFGYRVFSDIAMEVSPGHDVGVSIVEGKSVLEIGELLEEKGLIKDAKIFFVQELLSEYHGKLEPGIYTLNTSMNAQEIMAVMAQEENETGQDKDKKEAEETANPETQKEPNKEPDEQDVEQTGEAGTVDNADLVDGAGMLPEETEEE